MVFCSICGFPILKGMCPHTILGEDKFANSKSPTPKPPAPKPQEITRGIEFDRTGGFCILVGLAAMILTLIAAWLIRIGLV